MDYSSHLGENASDLVVEDIKNGSNSIEVVYEKNSDAINKMVKSFSCNICKQSFLTNIEKTNHVKCHLEKHVCPFCAKIFLDKNTLLQHCTVHLTNKTSGEDAKQLANAPTRLQCRICLKQFSRKFNLRRHFQRLHPDEHWDTVKKEEWGGSEQNDKLNCDICLTKFTERSYLKKHLEFFHSKNEEDKLKVELKKFKALLEHNISTPHSVINFKGNSEYDATIQNKKCPICSKKFLSPSQVKRHINIVHYQQKHFICPVCNKSFASKYHLDRHLDVHMNSIRSYECPFCSKLFALNQHLQRHILTHSSENPFKCGVCDRIFSDSSNLSKHMNKHVKDVKCPFCEKIYPELYQVRAHIKKAHNRIIKCNFCTKTFGTSYDLNRHMNNMHSNDKCEI